MFAALDLAWRDLGFSHRDMRVANVLEHRPDDATIYLPKGYSKHKKRLYSLLGTDDPNEFKLPGAPAHLKGASYPACICQRWVSL